jgi:hypothetical protein
VVEGFLLLSERFRWFAFNEHKGWTMLVALAIIGATMLLMLLWFGVSLVFRRRFQFGIRALLLLMVVVAIPCGWLAAAREQARKQRDAVAEIEKAGGWVHYDYELNAAAGLAPGATPPGPSWLRRLLGDDVLVDVSDVGLGGDKASDAVLQQLEGLTQLRELHLYQANVTDAGLRHLEGLTQLQRLNITYTAVGDAGMEHLKGLTTLQILNLSGTKIDDAGLQCLEGLTRLQTLDLTSTNIADAGLKHLEGLTELQDLELTSTNLRDAGLEHLKGLSKLRDLNLSGAKITDAGLVYLKSLTQLQRLDLRGNYVSDAGLEYLKGLTQLGDLDISATKVTKAGASALKKALPETHITDDDNIKDDFPGGGMF